LVVGESGTVHGMLDADIDARQSRENDAAGKRNRMPESKKGGGSLDKDLPPPVRSELYWATTRMNSA
jgi:hypothetical protein